MESALIISHSDKGIEIISSVLNSISCKNISTAKTCGDARRLSLEKGFDLYIINSPVQTQSGADLAKDLIQGPSSQVIFIVKNDIYEYMSSLVEDLGIITISKPLNRNMLWMALKLSKATSIRIKNIQKQNIKLTKKIEDIKIIDRAKCILISHLNMNEEEAHKYIEKKAMNTRMSKRHISQNILNTYES